MSISVVQKATGVSSSGSSLSVSVTITGVTAGNTLIAVVGHEDAGGSNPIISVSDGQGSYTADQQNNRGFQTHAGIWSLFNANAGSHTITATASLGTAANSSWSINVIEVSGLGTSDSYDTGNNNSANTSTTPTSGVSAALAQGSELVVTCLTGNTGLSGGSYTAPPSGGNNTPFIAIYAHPASQCYFDSDYQINTSATTAVQASWGATTQNQIWSAAIATYKAAGTKKTEYTASNQGGF